MSRHRSRNVQSADGTRIAFHRSGQGPPVILVEAAGHAVLEPPLQDDSWRPPESDLTRELAALVGAGRSGDAVEHFHESIGVPAEFIAEMKATPQWAKMESVAHTRVYDCKISDVTTPALLGSVGVPTLVIDSEGSTDNLTGWAARVAGHVPHARHLSLPGEWHTVPDTTLAPVLLEFFRASASPD